jgi:hypothetical protein
MYIYYNDGTSSQWVVASPVNATLVTPPPLRGYIAGLKLTIVGTTQITVGSGVATDSTYVASMSLLSSLTKGVGGWSPGNAGGLDTGVFAANQTYHWFVIRNPTSNAVDVLFSLSPNAPALPSGFTQFRRIASICTDPAAATWVNFVQDGDVFTLVTPGPTSTFSTPGTAAFPITLQGCPLGVRVEARVFVGVLASAIAADQAISWLTTEIGFTDSAPNINASATTSGYASSLAGTFAIGAMNFINTNSSGQIRSRLQQSASGTIFYARLYGWRDNRGKDS